MHFGIRLVLFILAVLGIIVVWIIVFYLTPTNTFSFQVVFLAKIYLIPITFFLWGLIVKPYKRKYIPWIILGIVTIYFISTVYRNYQGEMYWNRIQEDSR